MRLGCRFRLKKNKKLGRMRQAQSFLEYAFFIAVMVSALLLMRVYMSRSLQGHLKQQVDRLGSERASGDVYIPKPGQWYGVDASSAQKISTWGFDYEHGIEVSFGISAGGAKVNSASNLSGIVIPDELAFAAAEQEPLLEGGEGEDFFAKLKSSSKAPEINKVESNVGSKRKEWQEGYYSAAETNGREAENLYNKEAERIISKYIPEVESDPKAAAEKVNRLDLQNQAYAAGEGYDQASLEEGAW